MFKVTLKIKPNGEWVDGPVLLVENEDMEPFSETHSFFKCEDAKVADMCIHPKWNRPKIKIPSGFKGFLG